MMKIIHCSDLHLDSKMESNLPPEQARERSAEICATFGRMVRWANEHQVDAILIAGDLFDTRRVTARTADFVLNQIRSAENIEFFYLRGNHDAAADAFAGRQLPDNVRIFGSDWTSYQRGNITITGRELEWRKWDSGFDALALPGDRVNIVMLHGQISTQPSPELIPLSKLRGKNIHYLALGHIHSYRLEKLDEDGLWCYSGCLEGRGFDECGEKGFVLLDIENRRIKREFIPFAARQLYEIPVDITDLVTVTEIQSAMERAAEGIPSSALVKFVLTGSFTPDTQKDLPFLKKMLEPLFWFVKIKDESRLKIDRESYEHDASLKGEFIRMVMASDKTEEEKETIICCGLRALAGEEVEL